METRLKEAAAGPVGPAEAGPTGPAVTGHGTGRRYSAAERTRLLVELERSGETVKAFCRRTGVGAAAVYAWRREQRGADASRRPARGSAAHKQAGAVRQHSPEHPALLPVRVVESRPATAPAPLELVLAGGHRLRIGADFDAALLCRLLGALAQC